MLHEELATGGEKSYEVADQSCVSEQEDLQHLVHR
jgi:hypothetical protein